MKNMKMTGNNANTEGCKNSRKKVKCLRFVIREYEGL